MSDSIENAMRPVIEAERGRDRFRQLAKQASTTLQIDAVDRSMADGIIQLYRQLVPLLLSDDMRKRFVRETVSLGGRHPNPQHIGSTNFMHVLVFSQWKNLFVQEPLTFLP